MGERATDMVDEMLKAYKDTNRALWDEWTAIHERSSFYDVEGFRAGKITLRSIERDELRDVSGKTLLHLQCHFGLDTLSWVRLGAIVTGVDFSPWAIARAEALSEELGIPARFVCTDVYDLPRVLSGEFDIVFTSYGVLCWLPDLSRWGQVIAQFLRPGGAFYMVEEHPFANVFGDDERAADLHVTYPYFHSAEPLVCETHGSYADRTAAVSQPVSYQWVHSLGGVVNALRRSGLVVEFIHEFPFCTYQKFPFMERGSDGWWRLKSHSNSIPLLFSLQARKGTGGEQR